MTQSLKQNVTVSLSVETIQRAKALAAQRSTSISQLLAEKIESLLGEHDAYEQSAASAIARMERGLHLGGQRIGREHFEGL
jgi:predicted DNA-binding protein